jgi:hypothetical protein
LGWKFAGVVKIPIKPLFWDQTKGFFVCYDFDKFDYHEKQNNHD